MTHANPFTKLCLLVLLALITYPRESTAIAYCALRDPVEAIRFLFPHADSHRSVVKAVDNSARDEILKSLSFSLHFNELGKHTLYTILRAQHAIGFVHVRSELAPWGLMEVAWALSPDLTVKNFMFQRCRSRECSAQAITEILTLVADKSLQDLKAYLTEDGDALKPEIAALTKIENKAFVGAIIRSALKTIAVTSITWADEVNAVQRQKLSRAVFGQDAVETTSNRINHAALDALKNVHSGAGSILDTANVAAYQVFINQKLSGYITSGQWHDHHQTRTTHWAFDQKGQVLATRTVPVFSNEISAQSFAALNGLDVANSANCSTASQLMGHDMFFLARFDDK